MCLFCMSSASLDIVRGQTEWKVGGRGPSVTHRYEQQCMRMCWPVCACVSECALKSKRGRGGGGGGRREEVGGGRREV